MPSDDEPRNWEDLRRDAVRAAVAAMRESYTAETLVDAVLSVVDEETVRALSADFIANTKLRTMDFRNGAQMEMEPAREAAALWVGAARGLLDGAENYSEISMQFRLGGDYQRYAFTCQKVGKLTPHEARKQAEVKRDEAVKLLEAAAHLRQNGECAPGGRENWHAWDEKAEQFLRGLAP